VLRHRLWWAGGGVVIMLATAITACDSSGSKPTAACASTTRSATVSVQARPPAVPTRGSYFGAFTLAGAATQQDFINSFDSLAATACRPLDLAHVYLPWGTPFPTPAAVSFARQGAVSLVSWTGTDTRTINSGAVDTTITATAHQIAALNSPVFLEFRWEMDRPNLRRVVHSPHDYIAAWDRVRRLFAAAGTTNVSWVWCPTANGFADGQAQAYYPGDSEVDWVCTDAYPSPTFGPQPYQPLRHLLRPFLNWAHGHDKPAMIGEFGVPRSYSPQRRAEWLEQAKTALTRGRQIKAVAYFDYNPPDVPLARTYALGDDPQVVAAFRALAADPYFRPTTS
jgi:hypothetical protein